MKRDQELMREILLYIVEHGNIDVEREDDQHYVYQLKLICQRRMVDGIVVQTAFNRPPRVQKLTDTVVLTDKGHDFLDSTVEVREESQAMTKSTLEVFLSHSSTDRDLAKHLISLLQASLNIATPKIRCTSVPGYKLRVGADTDGQLKTESVDAIVFVGLITDISIESAYVLFELGARWGTSKFMAPLLGAGATPSLLKGPLSNLNALLCNHDDLHQFVRDVGTELGKPLCPAESYTEQLSLVIETSERLANERKHDATEQSENPQETKSTVQFSLNEFQIDYLLEISKPRNNGALDDVVDKLDGRDAAKYREAVELFQVYDLMTYASGRYKFTSKSWKVTDQLWVFRILDALDVNKYIEDKEICESVGLTDGQVELDELHRLVSDMEDNGFVTTNRIRKRVDVRILDKGVTHARYREIKT